MPIFSDWQETIKLVFTLSGIASFSSHCPHALTIFLAHTTAQYSVVFTENCFVSYLPKSVNMIFFTAKFTFILTIFNKLRRYMVLVQISLAIKRRAGQLTISSCLASFLDKGFHVLGNSPVNNLTNIRTVNS